MLKPVEMLNISDKGVLKPIRFRIPVNDNLEVIKITSSVLVEENRKNGNAMKVYRCKVMNNGLVTDLKLFYEIDTCRWLINDSNNESSC